MNNTIITDSCADFNEQYIDKDVERVPFRITVSGEEMVDNGLDTMTLLQKMKASKEKISTSCPSPMEFCEACKTGLTNYIVTISSKLSGSYNSAMIAKDMVEEENKDSQVFVFDSKSAAAGENLIIMKIKSLIEQKLPPSEIALRVKEYISKMKTLFILENLDNLVKNGRISNTKALMGRFLHMVPIMRADDSGEIQLEEKVMGKKQAFSRLVEIIGENIGDFKETVLAITHSNALEKANALKKELMSRYSFKDIVIFKASGLSSAYADDGGIIVAF